MQPERRNDLETQVAFIHKHLTLSWSRSEAIQFKAAVMISSFPTSAATMSAVVPALSCIFIIVDICAPKNQEGAVVAGVPVDAIETI